MPSRTRGNYPARTGHDAAGTRTQKFSRAQFARNEHSKPGKAVAQAGFGNSAEIARYPARPGHPLPKKWLGNGVIARENVRSSPLPPVQNFQPHPARTPPQPCFIILVIPTPNAAEESATPRHAKSGMVASTCKHERAALRVLCLHHHVACTSHRPCSI